MRNLQIAHAARHRAAEGEHPQQIHQKMHPARMHHHVGHEGGDAGEIAARKLERGAAVARRDEGEREQERQIDLVGQETSDELDRRPSAPRPPLTLAWHIKDRLSRGHGDARS